MVSVWRFSKSVFRSATIWLFSLLTVMKNLKINYVYRQSGRRFAINIICCIGSVEIQIKKWKGRWQKISQSDAKNELQSTKVVLWVHLKFPPQEWFIRFFFKLEMVFKLTLLAVRATFQNSFYNPRTVSRHHWRNEDFFQIRPVRSTTYQAVDNILSAHNKTPFPFSNLQVCP